MNISLKPISIALKRKLRAGDDYPPDCNKINNFTKCFKTFCEASTPYKGVCQAGPDQGKRCQADTDCGDGGECGSAGTSIDTCQPIGPNYFPPNCNDDTGGCQEQFGNGCTWNFPKANSQGVVPPPGTPGTCVYI